MNKEEIEYTIKTDRNTGEIVFSRGDYSFKQWGLRHEIIDLIEYLQQENKQLKENWNKMKHIFEMVGIEVNIGEYATFEAISKDFIFDTIIELENGDSNE